MKESDVEYVPVRMVSDGVAPDEDGAARDGEAGANPLLVVHRLLRGRYLLAIVLGVLGLVGGGVGGYLATKPTYQSAGMIRIRPNVPRVLYENEQNSVLPMFDAFVESQAAVIRSERVVGAAMEDAEWRGLQRGMLPDAVAAFNDSLQVAHPRNSELIQITFTDGDPRAAAIAVRAVVEAYQKISGDNDIENGVQRLQVLEDRRTAKSNELRGLTERIAAISNDVGSTAVDKVYEFKLSELQKLESELKQAELAVAAADTASPPPTTTAGSAAAAATTKPSVDPSVELLARRDPRLRDLLRNRDAVAGSIKRYVGRFGNNHPHTRDQIAELEVLNGQIEDYVAELRAAPAEALPEVADQIALASLNVDVLKARAANVRALHEAARKETIELGRKNLSLQTLREEAESVRAALDETKARIEQLNVESTVSGRVSVVSSGDRPLTPFKDKRKAFAGAGAAGGFGVGVGLVMLLGLVNRKLLHVADAEQDVCRGGRMLGILPNLPQDLSDPEQAAVAAFAVHQIRTMLQLEGGPGRRVYAITSPASGDGKTSLALALGMSFAASGSRTLLIDCDLVGGGLTAKVDKLIRPKLGQVLRRLGIVNDDQINEGLVTAKARKRRLAETLVVLGHASAEDVRHALGVQRQSYVGLIDVISGESVADCVTGTGVPGLFVLPLGAAQAQQASQLSPSIVRRIIDEARAEFDTVLVDTGPILGSLEASMVAAAVDGVVLTVSSGEQRPIARRASEHLSSLRAKLAGVVFNRARSYDLLSSNASSSVNRRLVSNRLLPAVPADPAIAAPEVPAGYGPIASAVAANSTSSGDAAMRSAATPPTPAAAATTADAVQGKK